MLYKPVLSVATTLKSRYYFFCRGTYTQKWQVTSQGHTAVSISTPGSVTLRTILDLLCHSASANQQALCQGLYTNPPCSPEEEALIIPINRQGNQFTERLSGIHMGCLLTLCFCSQLDPSHLTIKVCTNWLLYFRSTQLLRYSFGAVNLHRSCVQLQILSLIVNWALALLCWETHLCGLFTDTHPADAFGSRALKHKARTLMWMNDSSFDTL